MKVEIMFESKCKNNWLYEPTLRTFQILLGENRIEELQFYHV